MKTKNWNILLLHYFSECDYMCSDGAGCALSVHLIRDNKKVSFFFLDAVTSNCVARYWLCC